MGPSASTGTFADAAAVGEVTVLGTLGVANESALRSAGPDKFRGKVVIDATNPLDFSGIESSRYLEAMCMVWVLSAIRTNNWNQAFKLLRT
jgi:predicted dinucleotide-binding enzyme